MTKYNVKHADGTIVETFFRSGSARDFRTWYKGLFREELIIEKEGENRLNE